MENYRKIDMAGWPRREHYEFYTKGLMIQFNLTSEVRVGKLLGFCHSKGYRFYPSLICIVTEVVNSIENLRMFRNRKGELCIWDSVVPNYTMFHDDDKTFSDCWSMYSPDFDEFYGNVTADMERYKDVKGIRAKPDTPPNLYCISCAPWMDFSGFSTSVANGEPQFFPVITMGKYSEKNGEIVMPVNFMIAHAVCDGYHTGLFFNTLQKKIDSL